MPPRVRLRWPSGFRRCCWESLATIHIRTIQEANRVFWRQSVLPLAGRIGCALTHWLAPVFGEGRTDKIEALSTDRAALWTRQQGVVPQRQ